MTAWQRFLPTGPIALLPVQMRSKVFTKIPLFNLSIFQFQLNKQLSSLVWTVDKPTAKILMELPLEEFTNRINQALVNGIESMIC